MTLDTLIKTIEPQRSHIELRAILNGYDRERFQALLNDGIITEIEFDILLMHYAEGKDFRYIGDMLGYSESSMKKIHLRILDKIEYKAR